MRLLRASAIGFVTVLVACGGGGNKPDGGVVIPDSPPDVPPPDMPPDSPAFDFSCETGSSPTTAPDPLALSGTANDIDVGTMMPKAVEGAAITAFKSAGDTKVGETTSDAQGAWALSLATGGNALDGYVEGVKAGQRTVRLYPPNPLSADFTNAPLLMLADSTFDLLLSFVLQDTQDAAKGTIALAIVDCQNQPISGATVTVTQGGTEVGRQHEVTQLSPGAFFVLDVPPGDALVGATVMGHTLHAHTVTSVATTTTTTVVTPLP